MGQDKKDDGKSGGELDEGFFQEGADAEGAAPEGPAAPRWAEAVYEGPQRRPGRKIAYIAGALVVGFVGFAVARSMMKSHAETLAQEPAAHAQLEANCRAAYARRLFEEVFFTCARAIQVKPQAADIAVMLAEAQLERGHAAEAIDWAQKAIAMDPTLADAYVFAGRAHKKEGRAQVARAAFQKYLELAPTGRHVKDVKELLSQP